MKNLLNKIFILLICSGLAFGIICGIAAPVQTLEYENRYANKPEAFSIASYLSGDFQDSFELALADQIPWAEQSRMQYNMVWSVFNKELLARLDGSAALESASASCADVDPELIISDDAYGEGVGTVEELETEDVEISAKPEIEISAAEDAETTEEPEIVTEAAVTVAENEVSEAEIPQEQPSASDELKPETVTEEAVAALEQPSAEEESSAPAEETAAQVAAEEPEEDPQNNTEPELEDDEGAAEETAAEPAPVDGGKYIGLGNGFYLYNGYILEGTVNIDSVKKRVDKSVAGFNTLIDTYPELNFYLFYTEKEADYNFVTGRRSGVYEYLCENLHLASDHTARLHVTNFTDFSSWYYKSDHHWAYRGSYRAYEIMLSMLKPGVQPLLPQDELYIGTFAGSLTKTKATAGYYDEFYAFEFNFPEMDITVSKKKSDYGRQSYYIENARAGKKQSLSYGSFYGPDAGEIVIHNPSGTGNLLIFGNSYDNAVIKLLASHYENTYSMDMRYYKNVYGKSFVFADYIQGKDIDDVIHIGNANYFVQTTFIIDR